MAESVVDDNNRCGDDVVRKLRVSLTVSSGCTTKRASRPRRVFSGAGTTNPPPSLPVDEEEEEEEDVGLIEPLVESRISGSTIIIFVVEEDEEEEEGSGQP